MLTPGEVWGKIKKEYQREIGQRKIDEPLIQPSNIFKQIRGFTEGLKNREITQLPETSTLRYLPGELGSNLTSLIVPQSGVEAALMFAPMGKLTKPLVKTGVGKAVIKTTQPVVKKILPLVNKKIQIGAKDALIDTVYRGLQFLRKQGVRVPLENFTEAGEIILKIEKGKANQGELNRGLELIRLGSPNLGRVLKKVNQFK